MSSHRPLIPMGAITGRPTRKELHQMLESYRQVGIDQFLIYPRSGLEVEYMGTEWLEICRHIIEYCAEHNIAVWLYDEYNWPSGKCKGKVIRRNPAFASKKLVAFADRNFMGVENSAAPAPEYFWTEVSIPLYTDLLDPAAVDCFIELTHEVYYRHFGKYFGSTVKGIFSDEPSFMYAQLQPVTGSALEVPYYVGLKDDYRQVSGRELIPDFEQYLAGNPPSRLWYDYYNLLGKRFCREYLDRVRNWCDSHNILFTGHLMSEPYPKSAINASGCPIDAIRSFSMPGLDEIPSHTSFAQIEWNTFKLLESAMNGPRTKALAELFALGPSDMTFAKMRYMIYLVALHGVNHFVTAVSAIDARGNVEKPYYYNPVAPAQPWFRYIGSLNESAAVAAELTRKTSTASIALRYPQRVFCSRWDHKAAPEFKVDYTELVRALINVQWEFRLIGDDETAAEHYAVVLELNSDGAIDERSQNQFADIPSILAFLERTQKRRVTLCHDDGKIVERILLKSFDDGTICIVNTSDDDLKSVSFGGETFDMPFRDVAIFPRSSVVGGKTLDLNSHRFRARIKNQNTLRCIFTDNHEVKFETAVPMNVMLALRQYGGQAQMKLDEHLLKADMPCTSLPEGLNSLYRETAVLSLTPGQHVLIKVDNTADLPYLPLALIAGSFALGADGVIRTLPDTPVTINEVFVQSLHEYAGMVLFQSENDLTGYDSLTVEYDDMAVEVLIDDQSLGVRLWAPFVWSIPAERRSANAKIEVRVTTSIGPLFADYPSHVTSKQPVWLRDFWPKNKR